MPLARFGQPEDAEILVAYLDHYLPGSTATSTSQALSAHCSQRGAGWSSLSGTASRRRVPSCGD
ncbi:DUF6000 family protein [Actinoallomurus acanthiterrae]